ncbi:hypothetical protein [Helicobacter pylori]|nr:hypothetical protein [Helicobacter pylori]
MIRSLKIRGAFEKRPSHNKEEQANQEAYRPMKKAANDDYDMGM